MNARGLKLLQFFKDGGNIICSVRQEDTILNSVRGICCQNFENYTKFWVRQSSYWISPYAKISKDLINAHFPNFCTKTGERQALKVTSGTFFSDTINAKNIIKQDRLVLAFDPQDNEKGATEGYLPIFRHVAMSSLPG